MCKNVAWISWFKENKTRWTGTEIHTAVNWNFKKCPQFQRLFLYQSARMAIVPPPPFRSLKSGVPPSTRPPSGTSSSSMIPAAGAGTWTEVWKKKTQTSRLSFTYLVQNKTMKTCWGWWWVKSHLVSLDFTHHFIFSHWVSHSYNIHNERHVAQHLAHWQFNLWH